MKRGRTGFTLIEILLAVTLATILMAAVLAVLGGVARDQRRLSAVEKTTHPAAAIELLRWDLTNAESITSTADGGVVLRGHGGIDQASLEPTNRLTRVTYRIHRERGDSSLFREQSYLDDPIRPEPWGDLVMRDVRGIAVSPAGNPKSPQLQVQLLRKNDTITELLWVQ